jgi:hypothetical protein
VDRDATHYLAATRARLAASYERMITSLEFLIAANEELAQHSGHEQSARWRIAEAREELAIAEAELAELGADDILPQPSAAASH